MPQQVSASLNKSKQVLAGLDLWISVKKVFIATLKHCHLLVSCLFRSHTKENLSRLVKTSWDLSRHVDTCKDPDAKRFTESLNIFKSQSWLLIYRSQFWDSLRLVETCPGLPKLVQAYQNLLRLIKTCWDLSRLVKTCWDLSRLVETCRDPHA